MDHITLPKQLRPTYVGLFLMQPKKVTSPYKCRVEKVDKGGMAMAKFELSLTPDYVPTWTYLDGIRELVQNAVDQEACSDKGTNMMFWDYDVKEQRLTIGNKTSVLETRSLLLGATTKSANNKAVGQFGEGYKIAALVLTREGKPMTIMNYGKREIWRPRFVKSHRYGEKILTFFITKDSVINKVPKGHLMISVDNITPEEFEEIKCRTLKFQDNYPNICTPCGEILTGPEHKGKVFVNGLYITSKENFEYGYNFNPDILQLDRDRSMITDFDLKWHTSDMWLRVTDSSPDIWGRIKLMINAGASDVHYINERAEFSAMSTKLSIVADMAHLDFISTHGADAIPVSSQKEIDELPKGARTVVVNNVAAAVIKKSTKYVPPEPEEGLPFREAIKQWMENWSFRPDAEEMIQLINILKEHTDYEDNTEG